MFRSQQEKELYIQKLFDDVALFEWEVLHVSTPKDIKEVMRILSQVIVREKLQDELSFLYIDKIAQINFKNIKRTLFEILVEEWIEFCQEVLFLPKKDALKALKEHQKFLYDIAERYYTEEKRMICEEMVSTFLDYVQTFSHPQTHDPLVDEILDSEFVINKNLLAIYDFKQLFRRVRAAANAKNEDLAKLQFKIAEMNEQAKTLSDEKLTLLGRLERKVEQVQNKGLEEYDSALTRLKRTMSEQICKKY